MTCRGTWEPLVEEGAQRLSRDRATLLVLATERDRWFSTACSSAVVGLPALVHSGVVPHVYIVRCSDGSYYVGSTWDLERRISEHNGGTGAAYTRRRRPVVLAWSAELERVDEAYAMEKRIQGWSRAKREALIAGDVERLPALASRSWVALRARTPDPPVS